MALAAAVVMVGISLVLLGIYGADVAAGGLLPLGDRGRGMILGGPALILPFVAFAITWREPSRGLGAMIIASGAMIIVGGIATSGDGGAMGIALAAPGAVQAGIGAIKIWRS